MSIRSGIFLAALLTLALDGTPALADWSTTHGPAGASTRALTFASGGTRLLAGTAGGGVFLASAGFTGWTPASTGLTDPDILSLAIGVNENGGEVVLAGTQGGGVFASWNSGSSWQVVNSGLTSMTVPAVTAIRDAYFGFGMVLFAGAEGGMFRSNGGQNIIWVPRQGGMTNTQLRALASVPGGDENDGIGARDLFAATAGGVFLSTDGVSWWPKNTGLPSLDVTALAATLPEPFEWALFAATPSGVFRSTDLYGGWTSVGDDLTGNVVQVLLGVGGRIFAGTAGGGVFLSLDQGESWVAANSGLSDLSITALASDGVSLFAATGAGVFRRPISEMDPVATVEDVRARGVHLGLAHPNPFGSSVSLHYRLEETGAVRLSVHDLHGRRVADLVDGVLPSGAHHARWDGRDASGTPVRAGVYLVRLEVRGVVASKRVVLRR